VAGGWEPGDPMSDRADERAELAGGQRAIDPAVAFSQRRVVVVRAQHDLKCPGAAHQARQVLDAAGAVDHA